LHHYHTDVKSEIKNSAAECEKEGAKSNVLPENICKSEEDSQKENVKKDSCTKLSKMSMSNDKSKETTQSHCNKDTTESIPKTDTSVEDKDKIPEKNLDSQNEVADLLSLFVMISSRFFVSLVSETFSLLVDESLLFFKQLSSIFNIISMKGRQIQRGIIRVI
jgi:hypothetical protein